MSVSVNGYTVQDLLFQRARKITWSARDYYVTRTLYSESVSYGEENYVCIDHTRNMKTKMLFNGTRNDWEL